MDARLMLEENSRLATTLQHYRTWASQILARYQMVNPDAAKPPRRIYVGGLPPGTTEVCCFLCFPPNLSSVSYAVSPAFVEP